MTDAPLIHNYMGRITEFDHFAVGADLDIATWDSYPLGFLSDRLEADEAHKQRFLRQGDPDMQAFHHDLYRAVGDGRWWVMEQQPGPVNWAPYNPAPLPGMARFGRGRRSPMGPRRSVISAGGRHLSRRNRCTRACCAPTAQPAPALAEARQVAGEIAAMPDAETARAPVALIFDYASAWAWDTQPQGADFDYFRLVFAIYRALRRAGQSIDILPPDADVKGYRLVLAPGLATLPDTLQPPHDRHDTVFLFGPRTNAKTAEMAIPVPLPPRIAGLDVTVARVESLPPATSIPMTGGGVIKHWFEHLEGGAEVFERTGNGDPVVVGKGNAHYLGAWLDDAGFDRLVQRFCAEAGLDVTPLARRPAHPRYRHASLRLQLRARAADL